ncbi:PKD domain-containing protein [bacterium]|nr:PKD domain-containing protein [bacterium]
MVCSCKYTRGGWVFLLVACLAAALAACGGGGSTLAELKPGFTPEPLPPARGIAEILAEIDAAPVPSGVDPAVDAQLKAELKRVLGERGVSQIAITPPTGEKNKVTDLAVVFSGSEHYRLEWSYQNQGDYNQDKLVAVNDLTPVGIYFDIGTGDSNWDKASLADGNNDGLVHVADITPIGQCFNCRVGGYVLQRSDAEDGPWTDVSTIDFGEPGGDTKKRFSYEFFTPVEAYHRVVPTDGSTLGEPSNVVLTPGEPVEPEITDVQPSGGHTGESETFTATVTGTEPLTYAWDFGGGATPNTSTAVAPEVTLGAVGDYSASLTVTNEGGADTFDFNLVVDEGPFTPEIYDVSPQSGVTGELQTFGFSGLTTAATTFVWDFGGGATPATSTEASPQVTLGAPGEYSASLTATDEGGSDEFEFTLTVTATPDPPEITAVNPLSGASGAVTTITAAYTSASASPGFSWDFGSACTPSTSSAPVPYVQLGTPGEYSCSVTITDPYGSDDFPFTFTVTDPGGAPQIINVWPVAGETGSELTLSATVLGSTPFTDRLWTFEGGATPATSTAESPTVVLGTPGYYPAHLWLQNSYGEDTYDFTLCVTETGELQDKILAIPQDFDVYPGQAVKILVACFETANPFYALDGVRVSFDTGCTYYASSFNAGAPGGTRTAPDGEVWSAVSPESLVVPTDGQIGVYVDLGGGRQALDFWIEPSGGSQISEATGELFSFDLRIPADAVDGEQIVIGLERLDGSSQSKTYYSQANGTEHFWADDDNASIDPLDIFLPVFTLTDPPGTGSGTSADPYRVDNSDEYHFQVTTTKWGDVTADGRTAYHLNPESGGSINAGLLEVSSTYKGTFTAEIDFDGYYSDPWVFNIPDGYVLPADSLAAIPAQTTASDGDHVLITVRTNQTASPFMYLTGVGVTMETGNDYVSNTFNVGSPGGERDGVDGIWVVIDPTGFLLPSDFMISPSDIGGGRQRLDFNVIPIGGNQVASGTGDLFNFELEIHSSVTLGFEQFHDVKRTYYGDSEMNEYFWGTISNNYAGVPNSITLVP